MKTPADHIPNSFKSLCLSHEDFLYYKQDKVLRVFRFKFYS